MGLVERRIGLLFAAFAVLLCLAAARTAYLGAIRAPSLRRAAVEQQVSDTRVPAPRGTISDRNGMELAVSEPAADVSANPMLIKAPADAARKIAPLLGQEYSTVLERLSSRDRGFVYLARGLPSARARRLERLKLPGLNFVVTARRSYPQGRLAGQVLGSVGTDGGGLAGLEQSLDQTLHGRDGRRRLVKDALGRPISLREQRPARPGVKLGLTIDAAIQENAEEVLAGVGRAFNPRGATAVVMDPRSGDLLALANWPPVNPSDFGRGTEEARRNRAVVGAYEPGSTFKSLTVAAALQDGFVTPQTSFDLAPEIRVADRTIGEAHERGYETMTTAKILAQSSNVGAVTIGLRQGATRFDSWVRRFGFGHSTGIELPGEATGIVPRRGDYSDSSMGNLPLGQGLAVTPLQMASAYAAIANGGILRPPRIVHSVDGKPTRRSYGRRVISEATAGSVREMLEGVLDPGGTASQVSIPGYHLAGKTGTANKPDPEVGG